MDVGSLLHFLRNLFIYTYRTEGKKFHPTNFQQCVICLPIAGPQSYVIETNKEHEEKHVDIVFSLQASMPPITYLFLYKHIRRKYILNLPVLL